MMTYQEGCVLQYVYFSIYSSCLAGNISLILSCKKQENDTDTMRFSFCDADGDAVTLSHCGLPRLASLSVQQVQGSQVKWGHVTQLGNQTLLGVAYQSSYKSVH